MARFLKHGSMLAGFWWLAVFCLWLGGGSVDTAIRVMAIGAIWLTGAVLIFAVSGWLTKPVRLSPDYELLPEILVVFDGYVGHHLLKQIKGQPHLSVYWPGRGPEYILGARAARVTFLSENVPLDDEERQALRERMAPFGSSALWLEF